MWLKKKNIFLIIIIFFFVLSKNSSGEINFSSSPLNNGYIFNGAINSLVHDADRIFLGGNFTYYGPYKGSGFVFDVENNLSVDLLEKVDGIIWSVISDGNDGWYIGGDFLKIGDKKIKKLAHIKSDGMVDENFSFSIDDAVYALALKDNILYIGGAFKNIENSGINYLAAIDLEKNKVLTSFKFIPNNYVFSLSLDDLRKRLYLGGQFLNINGEERKFLAAIDLNGNPKLVNNFQLNNLNEKITNLTLSKDKQRLYLTGYFTSPKKYILAIDLNNISLISNFNPEPNLPVFSVMEEKGERENYLYLGGAFTQIGTTSINLLAKVNASTGRIIPFNCDFQIESDFDSVLTLFLDENKKNLYVGGFFSSIKNKKIYYFASFNVNNGCSINDTNLKINDRVNSISFNQNNKIFIGGRFNSYGGYYKKYLIALRKKDFLPDESFVFNPNKIVTSLAIDTKQEKLYLAGYFNKINEQNKDGLAIINLKDNQIESVNIPIETNKGNLITSIAIDNDYLYLGGSFTNLNNSNINYLAKFKNSGEIISTFHPNPNNSVNSIIVKDNFLYIGGQFTSVDNQEQNYFSVLDKETGEVINFFKDNFDGSINALSLDKKQNLLFVGGSFHYPLRNFLVFDLSNNKVLNTISRINNILFSLDTDEEHGIIVMGGYFNLKDISQNPLFIWEYREKDKPEIFDIYYDDFNYSLVKIDSQLQRIYLAGNFRRLSQDIHIVNFSVFSLSPKQPSKQQKQRVFSGGSGGSFSSGSSVKDLSIGKEQLNQYIISLILQSLKSTTTKITTTKREVGKIPGIPPNFKFTKILKLGDRNIQVKYLQIILKREGKKIYPQGKITGIFGLATKKAVKNFQEKYKKEILTPRKLKRGTGIVDKYTIKKLNQILGY